MRAMCIKSGPWVCRKTGVPITVAPAYGEFVNLEAVPGRPDACTVAEYRRDVDGAPLTFNRKCFLMCSGVDELHIQQMRQFKQWRLRHYEERLAAELKQWRLRHYEERMATVHRAGNTEAVLFLWSELVNLKKDGV